MTQSTLNWEKLVEHFARSRAHILQAINKQPGMTYMEIRLWIHEHKLYWMENVGARCRELYTLGYARRETGEEGKVHVFPCEAGGSGREHTT